MLTFETEKGRFNFRVAGIAIREDKVLLHRLEGEDFWSLPGGRGEFLENTRDTLEREFREEVGVVPEVDRLLWVVENFYYYDDRDVHELAFYYAITLPEKSLVRGMKPFRVREGDGQVLLFQWHRLKDMEKVTLYPAFLGTALKEGRFPLSPCHKVHTDQAH
ncbi:NUDIX hydrolase [Paludifilum halophilum]|nr:NUDIX hydrolase [Paludifilum halophilum]